MKPVNMAKIAAKYANKWIAVSPDYKKVYCSGKDQNKVIDCAEKSKHRDYVLAKIPPANAIFVL